MGTPSALEKTYRLSGFVVAFAFQKIRVGPESQVAALVDASGSSSTSRGTYRLLIVRLATEMSFSMSSVPSLPNR
jgi:hypothetical protein